MGYKETACFFWGSGGSYVDNFLDLGYVNHMNLGVTALLMRFITIYVKGHDRCPKREILVPKAGEKGRRLESVA